MTYDDFLNSVEVSSAEAVIISIPALHALWCEKKGEWDKAHELVQDESDANSAWVHAYLHRKEGDRSNARYWYRVAGQRVFEGSLEAEWEQIVKALLIYVKLP